MQNIGAIFSLLVKGTHFYTWVPNQHKNVIMIGKINLEGNLNSGDSWHSWGP